MKPGPKPQSLGLHEKLPMVPVSEFHILANRLGWSVGSAVAQGEELLRRWMYEQERLGLLKLNPPGPRQP